MVVGRVTKQLLIFGVLIFLLISPFFFPGLLFFLDLVLTDVIMIALAISLYRGRIIHLSTTILMYVMALALFILIIVPYVVYSF